MYKYINIYIYIYCYCYCDSSGEQPTGLAPMARKPYTHKGAGCDAHSLSLNMFTGRHDHLQESIRKMPASVELLKRGQATHPSPNQP